MMDSKYITDMFILFLSGAGKYKGDKEIWLEDYSCNNKTIEFPTSSMNEYIIRQYYCDNTILHHYGNNRRAYSEDCYIDGKLNGICKAWFENGNKIYQTQYSSDIVNGYWKEWYKDGHKRMEENYVYGVLDGLAIYWSPGGIPTVYLYKHGVSKLVEYSKT